MHVIRITFLVAIVSLIAASYGQCIRIRSGNGQQPCNQPPCCQPSPCGQSCASCGTSIEDLTTLLAIVRALEEKEAPRSTINNAEEIILQLVNALVYATTQNTGGPVNGGSGGLISASGGINIGGKGGISAGGGLNIGGSGGNGNGSVGGAPPTGGTGGNGGKHPGGYPTGTPIPMEHPNDGLITLDLLHGPGADHLVTLGIAGQNIVDVGLGNGQSN